MGWFPKLSANDPQSFYEELLEGFEERNALTHLSKEIGPIFYTRETLACLTK